MLCVSLAEPSVAAILRALRGVRFAEIRLDAAAGLTEDGIRRIFGRRARLMATFRPGRCGEARRMRWLAAAVRAGAAYVDIEIGTSPAARRRLVSLARDEGCRVLMSFHDYRATPAAAALRRVRDRGFAAGADIVKIACRSRGPRDNARLLGLLDDPRPTIVIGMGRAGLVTRVAAPLLGSPFTFAPRAAGRKTGPGQIEAAALVSIWKAVENA